ncbi:glycosyltransferase family 4 protein [Clostridium thermobutyricum]|uniref:glycosyltransferase family 4 protein n=1 Tax=Clostridium thermobutyricum TaxID=29372 RepID=UPI0018AB2CC5|nr:glycosyltransferase family 4 protein [Clostridium thermobutyricum]
MKKKDVLMVTHFTQIEGEKGNGRFLYIANNLDYEKINLEIVTTNFSHRTKQYREKSGKTTPYKLTLLNEPSYVKNVSLKRFYSHYIFSINVRKYLNNRTKPDLIYCSVPSLDCAYEVSKYAKKNNIKLILDIQDIWPEAFKLIFNIPILSNIIYFPMYRIAKKIYSNADNIIAVSDTYLKLGEKFNKNLKSSDVIFLGTELKLFDKLSDGYEKFIDNRNFVIAYIGTLGHNYSIKTIIEAIKLLEDKGIQNIKFLVMGDGPLKSDFENYAKKRIRSYEFTGRLSYEQMVKRLKASDIAVNPIVNGAASIINKVGDYSAAGLGVINTQECEEYRELIEKFSIGINCENDDFKGISEAINTVYHNKELLKCMGKNNRKLAELKFDREITYKKIYELIMEE